MPNGKQKLVMVPGTGVVAFPGDMEDEHVAAAIRAFRSQKAADQAAKSHPLNRPQPLMTEQSERQRQTKQAQPLSTALPHLPAWLNTPSTELGKQAGNWLSGEIGKALGTQLPTIDPSQLSESEAAQFRQIHPIAGGVAHGISDMANSLTTPASMALLMTAPESKLMSGLFSLQALHGAYKDAQAAREAYRQGNNEEATRYATESILGGAMGLAAGAHAVTPARGPQGEILPPEAKPQPELPSLPPSTPVTLEGKTGGFALPEYNEAPVANYQLIYKSPAASPEELNRAVSDLVKARESKGWSDPKATPEETKAAQRDFYSAADRLGKLKQQAVGQIRQIPSGEKIVYLTQSGLNDLSAGLRGRAPDPEYSLNGVSIAGRYIPIVQANLQALNTPHSKELTKLLSMGAGPDGTVTVSAVPTKNETLSNALSRLREELNHGWQKQFSDAMGNHLRPSEFKSLNQAIPDAMSGYLRQNGYSEDIGDREANRIRVLEASAKTMSGAPSEFGMTPDEAANYLFQYFDAVTKAHGPKALDELVHTTTLARNIKKDYANARYPSRGSQSPGTLPGLPAGGQGSPQAGAGAPGRGTAPVTGPPAQAGAATPSLAALRDEAALRRPSPIPGQTANLSYVSADESQPFYLKSDQVIDQKMKGPMSGPDVLRMLRNNGVKEDELETTGLSDLLSEDRKFTPEEVKEFAAANPVQIEEVRTGAPIGAQTRDEWAQEEYDKPYAELDTGQQAWVDRMMEPGKEPKYGQYTEPGGQNYRELLVTLPTLYLPGAKRLTLEEFAQQSEGKNINEVTPDTANRIRREYKEWREKQQAPQVFRGGHWNEPNVLVHIRANDRTLPNGKKVLHVEEIQSDWAQKGRKEGFAPSPKVARIIPLKAEHKDGYWEVTTGDGRFVTNAYDGEAPTEETAIALARYRLEHEPRRTGFGGAVPAMPFAKTWHELALRRILKYAVDHGYEGVSWTPGEKQAARYDLSKQVNRIAVIPTAGGNRAVRIEPKDGSSIKLMVDKEGTVTPAFSSDDQFAGKNIADVVGKDVADKIMAADKDTNLTGLDLKVGGSGMHGFYDKIVPDYLNKIGKKFGAKVGSAELGTKGPLSPVWERLRTADVPDGFDKGYEWEFKDKHGLRNKIGIYEAENGWWVYKDGEELESELITKSAAENAAIEAVKAAGGVGEDATEGFPFLPITPEMRSAFGEPMALFNQTRRPQAAAGAGTLNDLMEEAKRRAPAPSAPQSMEDMVGRRINTANAEDQDLSRAAHIENGEIVAYHLTDNPEKVKDYLESGKPLHEGGRAAEHDELGPGLYASDVPNYWMGRSTGKYGFLNSLTPEQADKLADAVQDRIDNAGPGYLSKSEVETAHRYIDQFRKDHHGDTLVLLAGQPYNVDFWKPDFLKSIGIEPSKQPEAVEVRAKGNFAEVKNYLRPAEWKALKDAGFDGAWVRAGFSTEPQLVIWNRNAITRFGDWKPSSKATETPAFKNWFKDSKVVDENGQPLVMYHGSPKTFTEFKDMPRQHGHVASLGEGHYFTSDRQTAENFVHGKKGPSKTSKLYEVYISAKSPFSVATADANRLVEAIKKVRAEDGREPLPQRVLDSYARDVEEIKADAAQNIPLHNEFTGLDKLVSLFPKRVLQEAGYDAIAFHGNGKTKPFNEIVVFDPKQVKSATENHGTFDPTNPDITMNQTSATKEAARPSVQALMAEALKHRPSQPTLSEVTKDIAARAPSVVP